MHDTIEHNGKTYVVEYQHKRVIAECLHPDACNYCPNQDTTDCLHGTALPYGGYTIAQIEIDLATDKQGHPMTLLAAIAQCSPYEQFSKRKGREVAKARLLEALRKITL